MTGARVKGGGGRPCQRRGNLQMWGREGFNTPPTYTNTNYISTKFFKTASVAMCTSDCTVYSRVHKQTTGATACQCTTTGGGEGEGEGLLLRLLGYDSSRLKLWKPYFTPYGCVIHTYIYGISENNPLYDSKLRTAPTTTTLLSLLHEGGRGRTARCPLCRDPHGLQ